MIRLLLAAFVLATATPSMAAPPPPTVITVTMTDYRFTPATIHLRRGVPVVLRLINAQGSHNYVAPELFASSTVAAGDASYIKRGAIEVLDDETLDIHFTPNVAGSYHVACTHFLHTMYGMVGTAIVE